MATNLPGSLDTTASLHADRAADDTIPASDHNDLASAVAYVEAAIGLNLLSGPGAVAAAIAAKQDASSAATQAELDAAVATINTALTGKQDASTAATDTELAAAVSTINAAITAHVNDTSAAHAASSIGFTPNGSIAATDVQAAIQEVRDEAGGSTPDASTTVKGLAKVSVAPVSATSPVAVGDNDPRATADQIAGTASIRTLGTGAQQAAAGNHTHSAPVASGVAFTPAGTVAATDVQAAVVEVAAEAAQKAANLSDLANAATARTNLGLGTAATQATGAFDASGAAAAAQAASQPLDSDLTAIAALTTTSYGRALLALADAAAGRTAFGLGTAATQATGAFDAAGAAGAAQTAAQSYADGLFAANDALVYKGVIDASGNPNYPAASAGHLYKISVAGKIGGASGANVEVGDSILCTVDGSSAGTQAAVGANWSIIQTNIDGAVIGPASSVSGDLALFNGTGGKLLQGSGLTPTNDDVLQRKAGAWTNRTLAQVKADLALVKGDVGLGNVDNTSDANKPVSTAQATAIGLKAADTAVVHNTGAETVGGVKTFSSPPIVPTPVGSTDAVNKAYADGLAGGAGGGDPANLFRGGRLLTTRSAGITGSNTNEGGATKATYGMTVRALAALPEARLVYHLPGNCPNKVDIGASIEFASGKFMLVFFGGKQIATLEPGGYVVSDPVMLELDVDALPYVRTFVDVTSYGGGAQWSSDKVAQGSDGMSTGSDLRLTGTPTATGGGVYGPVGLFSTANHPAKMIGLVGDSIAYGTGDSNGAPTGRDLGFAGRAFSVAKVGVIFDAVGGEVMYKTAGGDSSMQSMTEGIGYRMAPLSACTAILNQLGVNDFLQGRTGANMKADVIAFAKRWKVRRVPFWQMTCTPATAISVDAERTGYNDWLRDGAPVNSTTLAPVAIGTSSNVLRTRYVAWNGATYVVTGTVDAAHPIQGGVIEVADAVENTRNSGTWKAGNSPDNLHPNATGHAAMATAIPVALMTA